MASCGLAYVIHRQKLSCKNCYSSCVPLPVHSWFLEEVIGSVEQAKSDEADTSLPLRIQTSKGIV